MHMRSHISEEGVHDLVGVLEGENDIVRVVDPVTRRVLYWRAEESNDIDDPCRECNAVWGRRRRCANCTSLEALRHRQRMFKAEMMEGRAFWVQSRPLVMDGKPCVLETVNDVTDGLMVEGREAGSVTSLIESLNDMVVTDALTALFNRRFLDNFVKRLPDIREAGQRLNIAMVDLDDMKDVNDEYGHPAGDAVLRDVAGFLMLNFSQGEDDDNSDVEQYAVRYGGDEFIVLNIGSDPGEFACEVRGRYAEMRRVCYFEDLEIPFSLSIGIATTDELGWDWTHLLEVADQRMYEDKRAKEAAED